MDKTYPFDEAREALAYLAQGHARGKVVLTMTSPQQMSVVERAEEVAIG